MIAVSWVQEPLNALGWVLAELYDLVGNYGVAIILLTIGIRILLVPLGIKQIRSMHGMQKLQPKIKELQRKHKGNKQKQQEEIMKLYQEHGVSPFGSCLPMLLQLPVLFALYAVLRPPIPGQPSHLPQESQLQVAITQQASSADFLTMNLQCAPDQAGDPAAEVKNGEGKVVARLDCGSGPGARIPSYALLALMVGGTFYQTRQMQKVSPPGAQPQQQKMLMYMMPIVFGFFGLRFPSGLILYWTTSTLFQIGQQHFMLTALKEETAQAVKGDGKAKPAKGKKKPPAPAKPAKKGIMGRMIEAQEQQRAAKLKAQGEAPASGEDSSGGGSSGGGNRKKRRKR